MSDEASFLAALEQNPEDETTRLVFADWLEERGDPRAEWLRDADLYRWAGPTLKDPVPEMIKALGKPKTREQITRLLRKQKTALPYLIDVFRDGTPEMIEHVREILEGFGSDAKALLPAFRKEAHSDDVGVRARGIRSLGFLGESATKEVSHLIEQLDCDDDAVFAASVGALGSIGPEARAALPRLAESMERAQRLDGEDVDSYSSPEHQMLILEAVEQIGLDVEHVFPMLLDLLDRYNHPLVEETTHLLGKFDSDEVGDRVLRSLSRMGDFIGHGVGIILSYEDKAAPLIVSALADEGDPEHRDIGLRVLETMAERGAPFEGDIVRAVPILGELLVKANAYQESRLLPILKAFGKEARAAEDALRQRLQRKTGTHRDGVLAVLRQFSDDEVSVLEDVERRLKSEEISQRQSGVRAILNEEVPTAEQDRLLRQAFADQAPEVRESVIRSIRWAFRDEPKRFSSLVESALLDEAKEVRQIGVGVLNDDDLPIENAVSLLLPMLEDPEEDVRIAAFEALGRNARGNEEAVLALQARLRGQDRKLRFHICQAFQFIRLVPDGLLEDLFSLLEDEDDRVRHKVLWLLEQRESLPSEPAPALLGLLDNVELREAAVRVLAKLDDPPAEVAETFWRHLNQRDTNDEYSDATFRMELLEALAKWDALTEEAIPHLVANAGVNNNRVHESAVALLLPFGADAIPEMVRRLQEPSGTFHPVWLVRAMREWGTDVREAVPTLLELLRSENAELQLESLRVLHTVGPEAGDAVPLVLPMLNHEHLYFRSSSRGLLPGFGSALLPHLDEIVRLWRSDDCVNPEEYTEIFCALAEHTSKVLPILVEIAKASTDSRARDRLAELGPAVTEYVPELLPMLKRTDPKQRADFAKFFGNLGIASDEVLKELRRLAKRDVEEVREAARLALEKLDPKE